MSDDADEEAMRERERVRVLVVDDEPAICKALTIALQRAGYEALSAQSGDSALALLANEHVDVLLIDLRIPDTRGDVVFELAAATHPHLRHQTLFMTGDISERASRLVASCKCPMIKKPFELRDMLNAVEALLPEQRRDARGQSA
ncbi:MAG TPA: response regulator [Gemmatimonadaceae bacterium]|nr:response regulator [Gemmatimonadaceae bacterium]